MSGLPNPAARFVAVPALLLAALSAGLAADTTARLTVSVTVCGRTHLTVTARVLHFDVPPDAADARAALDFVAAARTEAGGEVVLTVEPESWLVGPGGAADAEATVGFDGDGEGTLSGVLQPRALSVVGRWAGSGRRDGRLSFTLATAVPGSYRLPLRFALSTP